MSEPAQTSAIVRRVLPADPATVYAAWLDPVALASFICPPPSVPGTIECDPRVGGRLRIDMLNPPRVTHIVGEFLELDRPRRLRFTWDSDYGGGFRSIVTVMLEPAGADQTLMTIEHAPLPARLAADHERGWGRIVEQLAEMLNARR